MSSKPSSPSFGLPPTSEKTKLRNFKVKHKNRKFIHTLTRSSAVAAVYIALTMFSAVFGLSSGAIQLRLSESICLIPLLMPEAVPGLFVGCFISNLVSGAHILDTIFGSFATLIGAYLGREVFLKFKTPYWVSTLPTLISNMIIIPALLVFTYGSEGSYLYFLITVGIGEFITASLLGTFIFSRLKKSKFLF